VARGKEDCSSMEGKKGKQTQGRGEVVVLNIIILYGGRGKKRTKGEGLKLY